MIIFMALAIGLIAYNEGVDKPKSAPTTTKEIYEAKKRDRQ
jgi:hypothetical protein